MDAMDVKITNLRFCKRHTELVARWLFDEWGHLRPGRTLESSIEYVARNGQGDGVPSVYVAEIGGDAVGTVSLVEHDMDTRKDLTPWLASVYVHPEHRQQGVGSALVTFIEALGTDLNIERIYLFTPDRQRMYARLGWRAIEDVEHRGELVTIMQKDL
jgi:GNAT superfamily N-acetyltransferase